MDLDRHRRAHPEFLKQVYRLADYVKEAKSLSEFEPDLRLKLEKLLDLLKHASSCSTQFCNYQELCGNAIALYGHILKCKRTKTQTSISMCKLCKAMARIGKFHARTCNHPHCGVPYCRREKKEHKQKRAHRRVLKRNEQDLRKQLLKMTISRRMANGEGSDRGCEISRGGGGGGGGGEGSEDVKNIKET